VSLDVVTLSVSAPPCFAYSVPPTLTVPAPPLKDTDETLEAPATVAASAASTVVSASVANRASQVGPRRDDTAGGFVIPGMRGR
jgi:hypothetical protein